MNFRNSLDTIIFTLIISLFTGCGSDNDKHQNNTIITSYRLIDEQRTDEAIELLESELVKAPDNYELTTVLASAYAHKSGVKIQNLISAINQTDKLKNKSYENKPSGKSAKVEIKNTFEKENSQNQETNQEQEKNQRKPEDKMNAAALNIASLLTHFTHFFETYASIPVIDSASAVYLTHAISLLEGVKKEIKAEDALYKAVLEVVLFKYRLTDRLIDDTAEVEQIEAKTCQINLDTVHDTILELGNLLINIYQDLALANPKQASDLKKLSDQTQNFVTNVSTTTANIVALDDASSALIEKTAIQNGFGKLVKCGNN